MRRNQHGADYNHDAWSFLPTRFVTAYSALCSEGLASTGAASYDGVRVGGSKEPKSPLKAAEALAEKARVDRVLRKLATEVTTGRRISDRVKCPCGRFMSNDWAYCAWCGLGKGGVRITNVGGSDQGQPWIGGKLR